MTINYSKQVLVKRGNTAVSSTYTGPLGEITQDTDLNALRVHDGVQVGGYLMARYTDLETIVASNAMRGWQIVRSNYTAQNGDRIIADTSGGSFTITLPDDPQEGFYVELADGGNFAENNLLLTSARPVEEFDQDIIFDINGLSLEFVYVGTAWQILTTLGVKGDKGDPGDADLTAYATKEYVDDAIAAIASFDGGGAASEYDEDETIDGGGA